MDERRLKRTGGGREVDLPDEKTRGPLEQGRTYPTWPLRQAASHARLKATKYRSKMASMKRPMQTPTVAPAEDGIQDANQSRSPPIVPWKYIFMLMDMLEDVEDI